MENEKCRKVLAKMRAGSLGSLEGSMSDKKIYYTGYKTIKAAILLTDPTVRNHR